MANGKIRQFCVISGEYKCPHPESCLDYIKRHKQRYEDHLTTKEREKIQKEYRGFDVMGLFLVGDGSRCEKRNRNPKIEDKRWLVTTSDGRQIEVRGNLPFWVKPNQAKEIK